MRDSPTETEYWIKTPIGTIYAKSWQMEPSRAEPVVLFHESLGCVDLWKKFPAILASHLGRRVIAYDRLGYGRSSPRSGTLELDFISREAECFMPLLRDALSAPHFIALGHSTGGSMAIEVAARYQKECVACITIGAQTFVEPRILEGIGHAQEQLRSPGSMERLARYHDVKTEWILNAWIDTWSSPKFRDWTLKPALQKARCPVLAIHGALDEYGSIIHASHIAGERGTAIILPAIGHSPHRECPEELAHIVGRWLSLRFAR